jgi:hypothetical protein
MTRTRWEDRGREDKVVFRTHWIFLIKRLAACVPFLVLSIGFVALVRPCFRPLWLLPLIPLIAIAWIVVDWRRRIFVFHGGRLYKPMGFLHLSQNVLNFSFAQWTLVQSFLGKLLDYGDVEIGMGNNPDRLKCIARFAAFVEALDVLRRQQGTSQQSTPPQVQQQAVVFMTVTPEEDGAASPIARRPARTDRDVLWDGDYIYKGTPFDVDVPSYAGFLAFCDEFILRQRNWATWYYISSDPHRRYYPHGIGSRAAQFYLEMLERTRIIRGVNNGDNGWVSPRIHTLEDIKLRVPYFERFQPLQPMS